MTKEKNIPKLRFPGFEDEWEERKLGDIIHEFSVKSKTENEHIVLSSTNSGMEIRNGRVSGTSNIGYKIVENGDLIISPQNLWLGNININNMGKGLVSPSYKTFKLVNLDKNFFEPQIRLPKMLEEYKNASSQGASVVRRNLELELFFQIPMRIPCFKEQKSIGEHFNKLDNLITLNQQKLEALKEYKKAMLQKMFPKNGEKVPEIRFPGFEGEWEKKKIQELGEVVTGSTPSTNHQEYYSDDGIPWVTPTDISENITYDTMRKLSKKGQSVGRVVPENTILVTCIASIGKNTLLGTVGSFNQQINGLIPDIKKHNPYFLFTESILWSENMKNQASSGTMQIVNKSEFSKLNTMVPDIEEQKQIGIYFKNLDDIITLHQQKLNLMKEYKKGLLQQMFV